MSASTPSAPTASSRPAAAGDGYRFDVGGAAHAALLSPKLSVIVSPWRATELYASAGNGFHSNDGRAGTLARTTGAEIGMRTVAIPRLQSTVAFWGLDIASELVFVGDAGTTEASRPSRRTGVEWSNYYRLTEHLVIDADLAYSRARFRDGGAEGDRIPGAVEGVVAAGISVYDLGRFSGGLRYRYLGPRPLVENNRIRSGASDIDYFYRSRLPGEPREGSTTSTPIRSSRAPFGCGWKRRSDGY